MTDDKAPEGLRGPGLFVIYHWSFVIDHFDPGRSFLCGPLCLRVFVVKAYLAKISRKLGMWRRIMMASAPQAKRPDCRSLRTRISAEMTNMVESEAMAPSCVQPRLRPSMRSEG